MKSFSKQIALSAYLLITLIFWLVFSFDGVSSAVGIWYGNEIFNHGFLVLPAVVYFVYIKRGLWLNQPIQPTALAAPFIIGGVLLYVIGYAGDIKLFMHTAAFGLLPFIIWFFIGHKATYQLLFPLFFIVFTIPVGEQLVPWLQEVTADISVYMLKLTGVPLFRSGLYIEIPQGRFLVAEACSGISFFIASIVVGCVYSYLNFVSTKKRIGFMVLSIVYPIIANAIRVYGIILTGYLTDMEHAVGADHLIYGWFFFAIVLVSLLAIGEWVRDKDAVWEVAHDSSTPINIKTSSGLTVCIVSLFIAGYLWMSWIHSSQLSNASQEPQYNALLNGYQKIEVSALNNYKPALNNPTSEYAAVNNPESNYNLVYQAWFDGLNSELVSGLHRLYSEKEWSLVRTFGLTDSPINNLQVRLISDPVGNLRLVAFWYDVDSTVFTSASKAKLYQTGQVLTGYSAAGLKVVVSVPIASSSKQDEETAYKELRNLITEILAANNK